MPTAGLGPYIAVLKTHIDIVSDFSPATIQGLLELRDKHDFLIFEDRKLVDIGHTVQLQYHGGALRISEWADIVNCTLLPGPGVVQALAETAERPDFDFKGQRGLLILAEMTSKGSLATGRYTEASVDAARAYPEFVVGFVSTRSLETVNAPATRDTQEDFVVFTTGVNVATKGDALGQQYQTPQSAVARGADFIIAGRGIYEAPDPVQAAINYRDQGWEAYLNRINASEGQ